MATKRQIQRTAKRVRRQATKKIGNPLPAAPPAMSITIPGKRTELNEALALEIADRVANCASLKDAFLLSGVEERTGHNWISKGNNVLRNAPIAVTESERLYVRLVQLVEGAAGRRRTLLKLQIRRAAQGTEKRPGDWRAAAALGALTDPNEFVPQIRVHVERQIDSVLNGLHEAFKNEPELLARALHAVIGSSAPAANAPEDPNAPPEEQKPN